jgi:hypothetical protein
VVNSIPEYATALAQLKAGRIDKLEGAARI